MSSALNRALGTAPQLADGCCRLSVASSTSLLLLPFNGNVLYINGQPEGIPAAGVTYASPGNLVANTLYYVYAYMNGATMALSVSTSAYTKDAAGRSIMNVSGTPAPAYRLVGMIYTNTAAAPFVDTTTTRWCFNYFNRRPIRGAVTLTSGSTTSTSPVSLGAVSTDVLFWADETVNAHISGYSSNNTSGSSNYTTVLAGGSSAVGSVSVGIATSTTSGAPSYPAVAEAIYTSAALAEGRTSYTFGAYVNGGTGTWASLLLVVDTRG